MAKDETENSWRRGGVSNVNMGRQVGMAMGDILTGDEEKRLEAATKLRRILADLSGLDPEADEVTQLIDGIEIARSRREVVAEDKPEVQVKTGKSKREIVVRRPAKKPGR
jgi:hypothetical protein